MSTQSLFTADTLQGSRSLSTAASGTGVAKAVGGARQVTGFLKVNGIATDGEVWYEHNEDSIDFAGLWWPIRKVLAAELVAISGANGGVLDPTTFPGHLEFVRWRIVTPIVGTTVTCRVNGLKP